MFISPNSVFIVPVVFIVCATIVAIVVGSRKQQTLTSEETRIMQELHQGLARLEERIEALETILFDRKHTGDGTES